MKLSHAEGRILLSHVHDRIPDHGHLEYDFNDHKQFEFAKMIISEHFDVERYPGKIKELELQKEHHTKFGFTANIQDTNDGFLNFFKIPGVGLNSKTKNTASNGFGTIAGGYANMSLILIIKDNVSGNIITSTASNDMTGALLSLSTPANSGSNNLNVTTYMQYSCTPKSGGAPISGIITQQGFRTVADPTISAPVRTCNNPQDPNAISIGLGRPWTSQGGNSGLDYAWNEPTQNSPIGKIPFVGSVIFNQPIKPLAPNTNFLLQVYVANAINGGTITLQATNLIDVYNSFSIDPTNPNKLNWNLAPGATTTDPGKPIQFGNVTWPTDIEALFYCQIIVTLADGSFGTANVQSLATPYTNPLDGTLTIMPIRFVWHCIGGGSKISMADGSYKKIERIVAGDKVLTDNDGNTAIVEWTNKGSHLGNVLKIKTKDGKEIVTSDNHLFVTENGIFPASELHVGQYVNTQKGKRKIIRIEEKSDFKGVLYNLATSTIQQTESGKIGTFIANGFQIGDVNSQKAYRKSLTNNKEWVKRQVPEYLHKDVESFFEDKAKKY